MFIRSFAASRDLPDSQDVNFEINVGMGRGMGKLFPLGPDSAIRFDCFHPVLAAHHHLPFLPPPQMAQNGLVRAVAAEFGRTVKSCGHLVSSRRVSVGPFSVEDAWTLDTLLPLLRR